MLCFNKDIHKVTSAFFNAFSMLSLQPTTKIISRNNLICRRCLHAIVAGNIPDYAAPWNISQNKLNHVIQILTSLEERLVSLHIAFSQIRKLGYKRAQYGLNGTIINVPVNFDKVQHAFPRDVDETNTIVVRLKHKLQYENAYA